jgi:TRAP-type C4-dicarboxylate transport system substrate-binding protein
MNKMVITLAFTFLFSISANALTLKIGLLAPEGTNWSKNLKKMAKEIKSKTNKKVKIKFYFGGSQGDEHDVLRKIRVGQLHGGIFTGKTLGDINGDVRVIELPFTFNDNRQKAWQTVEKMTPFFNSKFAKSEFTNLGFIEIGMVYFVSQKETQSLKSLSGVKIWSWEGDKLVSEMINTMDLVSVPLPLPDVLSSLSTGIIEAAYAPPLGIVSLQWNTKIKYLVDFPISFSIGAFLIENKKWNKISKAHQKIIKELGEKYIKKVNVSNNDDNKESLKAMKSLGVKFINFPESDIRKGKGIRDKVVTKLRGKLFSEKALKLLESNL